MNKNKDYAKMILNRLNSKATNSNLKSNSNSNQKTQATPTHNLPSTDPRSFFQQFQINCAVYHQPVVLKVQRKPLARPLYFQLTQMQYRNFKRMNQQPRPSYGRISTQPAQISEFEVDQPKRCVSKYASQIQLKDYKPNTYKKSEEKTSRIGQNCQNINRYRSLKTIPAVSGGSSIYGYNHIVGHYNSHYGSNYPNSGVSTTRRVLVPQIERREPLEQRNLKIQNRKISPREQLMKRCQSFQKFYLSKAS